MISLTPGLLRCARNDGVPYSSLPYFPPCFPKNCDSTIAPPAKSQLSQFFFRNFDSNAGKSFTIGISRALDFVAWIKRDVRRSFSEGGSVNPGMIARLRLRVLLASRAFAASWPERAIVQRGVAQLSVDF